MEEINGMIDKQELSKELKRLSKEQGDQLALERRFSYNHGHVAGQMSGIEMVIELLKE